MENRSSERHRSRLFAFAEVDRHTTTNSSSNGVEVRDGVDRSEFADVDGELGFAQVEGVLLGACDDCGGGGCNAQDHATPADSIESPGEHLSYLLLVAPCDADEAGLKAVDVLPAIEDQVWPNVSRQPDPKHVDQQVVVIHELAQKVMACVPLRVEAFGELL